MTTMRCALVVDRAAIPAAADVVRRVAEQGRTVRFPRGFEFTDGRDARWHPITMDGTKTGFDYGLFTVASLAEEDPGTAATLGGIGTHLLDFGARGQDSARAVTVVVRAICELSGASGWVEDEVIPADEMPRFLTGMETAAEELQARIAALPRPTKAEQDAAFEALTARRPNTPSPRRDTRIAMWICLCVGAGLVGWFIAMR